MSDNTLNRFLASGTAAQRAAFTPVPGTPASGPNPTYIWFETDTTNTYAWSFTGGVWVQINTTVGTVADGDKGAISIAGGVWSIDNGVVTLAKMADMATASVIYRKTAGTGAPEVQSLATLKNDLGLVGSNSGDETYATITAIIAAGSGGVTTNFLRADGTFASPLNASMTSIAAVTSTAFGRGFLDLADAAAARTKLALGTAATSATGDFAAASHTHAFTDVNNLPTGTFLYRKTAGTGAAETQTLATVKADLGITGTNSGDQTITLTGDVTGSGTGSFTATLGTGVVSYAKLQNAGAGHVALARVGGTAGPYSEVVLGTSQMLGRGSTGNIVGIGIGTGLTMTGSTLSAAAAADSVWVKVTATGTGASQTITLPTTVADDQVFLTSNGVTQLPTTDYTVSGTTLTTTQPLTAALMVRYLSTATVSVAAPVNTVAPVATGTAEVGQIVTSSTGTWTGTPSSSLTYQWYENSTATTVGASAVSGETANTMLIAVGRLGKYIFCRVTGTNTGGTSFANTNLLGSVVAAVSGLPAATLTRTSGVTTYPPVIVFDRPIEWIDGDQAVMQRSTDPTFVSSVSEVINTITSAVTSYDFGLSAVTSGSWFFRMAAWRGSRPSGLIWSNIPNVGDTTAPSVTSSASPTVAELTVNPTGTLTASEYVTWAVTGGADSSLFTLAGAVWTLNTTPDFETKATYVVQFTATDYAGNSTPFTMTLGINDVDEVADTFTFTDIFGATTSTVYTSNTITIAGMAAGVSVPVTLTGGTYSKNAGAYVSSATTATNGDSFTLRVTSSAVGATAASSTLAVGVTTDTYTVNTAASVSLPQAASLGAYFDAADSTRLFQLNTAATPVTTDGQSLGTWLDSSGQGFDIISEGNNTTRPVWKTSGGLSWVEFDGINDVLYRAAALSLWSASGYTAMIAVRSISNGTNRLLFGQSSTGASQGAIENMSGNTTATTAAASHNLDGGVSSGLFQADQKTNVYDGADTVLTIVDNGSSYLLYEDATAATADSYTRGANTMTMNIFHLGAKKQVTSSRFFPCRVYAVAIWPGVNLNSTDRATALTTFGAKQGRTL